MEPQFNEVNLNSQLIEMPFWKQLVFLVSICERLLPSFLVFSSEVNIKGESILYNALAKAKSNLLAGIIKEDLSFEQKLCESVAPDTEEYDSVYVSSALDAAICISFLMKAFTKNSTSTIVEATTLIRDSVDMYIQELEDMDVSGSCLESRILEHDLMQIELKRQQNSLNFLASLNNNQMKAIEIAKNNLFNKKESCLGI